MYVRMASMIRLTVCTPLYVTSYNSILPVIGDGQTYYCSRWLGQLVSETFRSGRSLITTITTNAALALKQHSNHLPNRTCCLRRYPQMSIQNEFRRIHDMHCEASNLCRYGHRLIKQNSVSKSYTNLPQANRRNKS
jgi:hypothetical protein